MAVSIRPKSFCSAITLMELYDSGVFVHGTQCCVVVGDGVVGLTKHPLSVARVTGQWGYKSLEFTCPCRYKSVELRVSGAINR